MKIIKSLFPVIMITLFFGSCGKTKSQEEFPSASQNPTLKTILNRKSVREYLNKEISPKIVDDLLKAGMATPSSRDRRPWQFIVMDDKTILEDLGRKLKNASL
jgi:hypothetical protein